MGKLTRLYLRFFGQTRSYVPAIIGSFFAAFGILGTWVGLKSALHLSSTWSVFVSMVMTQVLMVAYNRLSVQKSRSQRVYKHVHKSVEKVRTLRGSKKAESDVNTAITAVAFRHLSDMVKDLVGHDCEVCMKVMVNGQLIPIRSSEDSNPQSRTPEDPNGSPVYTTIVDHTNFERYIFIHDTDDEKELRQIFGKDWNKVKKRASQRGYRTFIALPINTAKPAENNHVDKKSVGMLGIDSKIAHGMKDLELCDIEALACVADLLSEVAEAFQNVKNPRD
jgi:hypothetical protein